MSSALQIANPQSVEAEHGVLNESLTQGLETEENPITPKPAKAKARTISPISGLQVSTRGNAITLQGRRLDPMLYNDLLQWLKTRG